MKALKLQAVGKRKFKATTDSDHTNPIYGNILNRNFKTTHINKKWCGDITYIRTLEGWMYLAVVIDLHSRSVIGWAMNKRMKKAFVCDALMMALKSQDFGCYYITGNIRQRKTGSNNGQNIRFSS